MQENGSVGWEERQEFAVEEYIRIVAEQIRCKKARGLVSDEIRAHIEDQAFVYEEEGIEKEQAVAKAVKDMGDPIEVGISLDRIHRPQMAWGMAAFMAVIGMFSILVHIFIGINDPALGMNHIIRQAVYTIIGFVFMFFVCFVDYSIIAKSVKIIMPVFLGLLVLGYFAGIKGNGAVRWISIAGITISLIPLTYLLVPLYGAMLYQYYGEKWRGIIKSLLWILPAGIPAYLYPDLSAGIALFGMMIMLFSLAVWKNWFKIKNSKRFLVLFWMGLILAVPLFFLILWVSGRLPMYQSYRIEAFLGAFTGEGRNDINYVFFQIRDMMMQSKFIGASGAAQMDSYLGVNVDYVITFLAVHFGYAAVILMAALFAGLIGKTFHMALKQKNELGMMMACGSGMVFFVLTVLYFMENASLLPVMSSELPFFSAGASNMAVSFILAGIVLSVYRFKSVLPKNLQAMQEQKKRGRLRFSISWEKE